MGLFQYDFLLAGRLKQKNQTLYSARTLTLQCTWGKLIQLKYFKHDKKSMIDTDVTLSYPRNVLANFLLTNSIVEVKNALVVAEFELFSSCKEFKSMALISFILGRDVLKENSRIWPYPS